MAAFLSLLCLGILVAMFYPSMVLFHQQSSLAEAQQQATVVLDRLRTGILNTVPETVSVASSQRALGWRPSDPQAPFSAQGNPNLAGHYDVFWWQASSGDLNYTAVAPAAYDFSIFQVLAQADFPTVPTPKTRILARHVTAFKVDYPIVFPLPVEITVSPPSPRGKPAWTLRQKLMPHVTLEPS